MLELFNLKKKQHMWMNTSGMSDVIINHVTGHATLITSMLRTIVYFCRPWPPILRLGSVMQYSRHSRPSAWCSCMCVRFPNICGMESTATLLAHIWLRVRTKPSAPLSAQLCSLVPASTMSHWAARTILKDWQYARFIYFLILKYMEIYTPQICSLDSSGKKGSTF